MNGNGGGSEKGRERKDEDGWGRERKKREKNEINDKEQLGEKDTEETVRENCKQRQQQEKTTRGK